MSSTIEEFNLNLSDLDAVARVLLDPEQYIQTLLLVKTKTAQTVPFKFTPIQGRVYREQRRRNIQLKPRQVGMSTYHLGRRLHRVCTIPNWTAVSIAHDGKTTELLFQTVKFFYDNLPPEFKPVTKYNNRQELYLPELNSRYIIFTAGSKNGVGRGVTVNDIHGSEVAFWPNPKQLISGLLETAPKDAWVDLESTANGAGGYFYEEYEDAKAGRNTYKPFFFPWWWQPEYRLSDKQAREYNVDPDAPLDEEEHKLVERYSLDREQINWRRWKKKALKEQFPQEYPEDDVSCFLTSGNTYFDKASVAQAKLIGERPPIELRDSERLKIWELPVKGHNYTIGADVAEGLANGDFSSAVVLDNQTGDEVASLHGHWPTHVYAQKLKELSVEYNNALLGIERNNHGHAVLSSLIHQLDYGWCVYHHQDYDQKTKQATKKPGWLTSAKTKPIMLQTLQQKLEDAPDAFHDLAFFGECNTFVYHDDGSIGAQAGCHDDRIMARAIAEEILRQNPGRTKPFAPIIAGQRPTIQNYRVR